LTPDARPCRCPTKRTSPRWSWYASPSSFSRTERSSDRACRFRVGEPRRAVAAFFFSRRRLPERGDAARGDAERGPAAGPAVCGRPRFMVRHGAPGAPLCSTRGGGWLCSREVGMMRR